MANARAVVAYGGNPSTVPVSQAAELETILDEVQQQARNINEPLLVNIALEACFLGIGVCVDGEKYVVTFDDTEAGMSLVSVGPGGSPSNEIYFFYGNQYSFYSESALIPASLARAAAVEFLRTAQLPNSIEWQDH